MQLAPRSEGSWVHRSRVEIKFGDGNERHGVTAVPKRKNKRKPTAVGSERETDEEGSTGSNGVEGRNGK